MTSQAGQHLFLDHARTLENVLLPHLSASTICRLACTCKGIRGWLWALDPSILKDTSAHEVSPAHAASLPTVKAALDAMRRAHTAVQNLAAAHSPQKQASQQPWTSEVMEGLLLSPDSQHCLVLYHVRRRNGDMRYGAAVHSLTTGKRLCTLSQEGREGCCAQFSPCSRRLSIATFTGPFDAMSCSLAVYETATWEPAYAKCSPEAEAALGVHGSDWRCGGVWAPDGRRFLYKGVDKPAAGCMYIIDAMSGQLEAALPEIQAFHAFQGGLAEAGWHPSSTGVITTSRAWHMTQAHTAALQAAGLAVGALQAPFAASFDQALDEGSRFSPDGAMLLARHCLTGDYFILSCTAQGQDLSFAPMHAFSSANEALQAARWHVVPGGACLVLLEAKGSCRLITPRGEPVGQAWGNTSMLSARAVSPSGAFCIGKQSTVDSVHAWAWVLVHCLTGQVAVLAKEQLQRAYWSPSGRCLIVLHRSCRPYRAGSAPEAGPFTTLYYDSVGGSPGAWADTASEAAAAARALPLVS